jgi:hypothetical protein
MTTTEAVSTTEAALEFEMSTPSPLGYVKEIADLITAQDADRAAGRRDPEAPTYRQRTINTLADLALPALREANVVELARVQDFLSELVTQNPQVANGVAREIERAQERLERKDGHERRPRRRVRHRTHPAQR